MKEIPKIIRRIDGAGCENLPMWRTCLFQASLWTPVAILRILAELRIFLYL